mmetsp:Transcript_29996/g.47874  ORF Transcript_29996/g.47874 Transcript_29996/m.47874 type:complete len:330 (+) Transcript_29996:368-1357(+)
MWIEKYRPSELREIVSHESVISTINELVTSRKLPHLLFYGPPGTGKTTTILACARELNGKLWKSMTLELNASDERGIDIIRDRIKIFASTKQVFNAGFKLIILDEADAMTSSAQFALRRVIEKYTKNTRFCIICNYVNKIIPALQSRCTKFRFAPLKDEDIKDKLYEICKQEQIPNDAITEDGIKSIMKLSGGDMRKCINILQSTWTSYKLINEVNVHECTGSPRDADIQFVVNCLLNKDFNDSFNLIQKVMLENGLALNDIINGIYKLIIRMKLDSIVLCQVLSELADLEHRLTVATNDKIQLASLVAIFQNVRHQVFRSHRKKTSPP